MTVAEIRHVIRQARMARWHWLRRLGKWRFVLLYGVIAWSIPVFIIVGVVFPMIQRADRVPFTFSVLFALVYFPFGVLLGLSGWKKSEKEYNRDAEKNLAQEV